MAKRFVVDSTGEKYPFSKGVLVKSLTKIGLSVEDAYKLADEVANSFKGTISSSKLSEIVSKLLEKRFGKKVAKAYRQLVNVKEILVEEPDGKTYVPFSRGILASSIRLAGLDAQESFNLAKEIADYLRKKGIFKVKRDKLREIVAEFLRKRKGKEFGDRYLFWREIKKLEKPLIILIGGATGVGKSKLAAELTGALEIKRMASTDSIREVMRKMISKELVPSIHVSSFEAGKVLYKFEGMEEKEKLIYGFLDQAEKVLTGVEAIICRGIKENVSLIIEGIHLIPGYFKKFCEKSYVIEILLTTLDEEIHRSRFYKREKKSKRKSRKYLKNFKNIRTIQEFLFKKAKENNVPIIDNIDFDETRNKILELIMNFLMKEVKV